MSRASLPNPTELSAIGIDIGKDVFHIIAFDPSGAIDLRPDAALTRCLLARCERA